MGTGTENPGKKGDRAILPHAAGPLRPTRARRTMSLPRFAFKVVCQVEMARMAAALSYRTIFGLIPMLVLGLVVLGAFSTDRDVAALVQRLLEFSGISQIVVGDDAGEVAFLAADAAWRDWARAWFAEVSGPEGPGRIAWLSVPGDRPGAMADAVAAVTGGRVDVWIADLVQNVRRIPLGTIGFVGLATLIYAAISMMVEIEKCFNQIYHAPEGRTWIRRVTQYWTLLTLGTLFLFASFYVGESLRSLALRLGELDHVVSGLGSSALTGAGFCITVLISAVLFVIVYTTMPNTRVSIGSAIVGAVVAAVLWESGKWGFTQYLRYSATYSRFYGSIALVPLFLLWVYVTWMIVLLGLSIAHAIQTHRVVRTHGLGALRWFMPDPSSPARSSLVDPAAILAVAAAVAERFADRRPSAASDVADRAGLEESIVADMLERLAGAGLLHRVVGGGADESAAYALSGPPDTIKAADVVAVGRALGDGLEADAPAARRVIGELEEAKALALKGRSLADYLAAPPSAPRAVPAPEPRAGGNPQPAG
ncbi:MAG: YihY family inner membrane protein [Phycisphaerae bacterium]|nr:YihY family inner membrane protein [Phycisphaerae bacterium]